MKNFTKTKKRTSKDDDIGFDYKNPLTLLDFIDSGKISPARTTDLRHCEQRELCNAIKKARNLGLVPASHQAHDEFRRRPEPITPRPFNYK